MYEVLCDGEKSKVLKNLQQSKFNIKNNLLLIDNNKDLIQFALQDIGRLMMNSPSYCLTESINNGEGLPNLSSTITLTDIDNFIITLSLKAYTLSDEFKNKGDIAFFISPMVFSYSLLLSYHIIINHIASILRDKEIVRFEHNQGILIVSDNKDILSHIWHLKVNEVSLKDFIPIYTLEAGKFKKVALQKEKRNNNYEDGTLPWICIYKAFQNKLPENLEKTPQVIILDLLPLKHRTRFPELIEWARKFAKHIIVIAPLYEDDLYNNISKKINNKVALDYFNLLRLDELVEVKSIENRESLMRSWTLNSSLMYFTQKEKYEIIIINGLNIYEEMIRDIYALFTHFNFKYNKNQISIKLNGLFKTLTNLVIPLELYERAKQMQGEYSIKQQINSCKQLLFLEEDSKQILETLILQINRLYDVIYEANTIPKGEVVLFELRKAIAEKKENILILVSDKICCRELKIWIKFNLKLELSLLNKIKIMYQKEWASNQIKIFNDNNKQKFDIIIIANPLVKKYLSFLYFDSKTNIKFVSLTFEVKLIEYQIRKITEINYTYMNDFKETISKFFNLKIMESIFNENKSISNCKFKSSWINTNIGNYKKQYNPDLNLVFNNNDLLEMFINEDVEDEIRSSDKDYEEITNGIKCVSNSNEKIKCIKIEVRNIIDGAKWIYFIPIEEELKIRENNNNEIRDRIITEIRNGDVWIKLKKDKKSELFDEILKLSTDTLVMQFIKMNTNEWREMVKVLWYKFYNGERYKNGVYEKILIEINKNGGSIKTSISVSNWITGAVTLVKKKENISAVAKILGEREYLDKVNIIYKSMRELWSIHIKLGKEIVKIIDKYASKTHINNIGEWVKLGKDIIINTSDISKTIDALEITQINLEAIFYVDIDIINRRLNNDETLLLNSKGAIKIE